MNCYCLW